MLTPHGHVAGPRGGLFECAGILFRGSLRGRANLASHWAAPRRWRGAWLAGGSSAGSAAQRSRRVCQTAGAQGAQGAAQPEAEAGKKDDSNVVDAEFTEVKDKKAG